MVTGNIYAQGVKVTHKVCLNVVIDKPETYYPKWSGP